MKRMPLSRGSLFLLTCLLFGAPSALALAEINGGDNEPVAYDNQELSYVCFDESLSDVVRVIAAISTLDTDPHSPVCELKRYIQDGYMLGLRDEVLSVLDYAEWFVDHYDDKDIQRLLAPQLEKVIEQVLRGELDVSEQDVMRSSDLRLTINSKARFRQDVRMDKKLYVHGKAHFDDDVTFRDDVKIKDNLTVVGNLLVEGAFSVTDGSLADITIGNLSVTNHTVSGTLSAADAAIGCDVSVGCNVKLKKSTSFSQGNITKESDSFIHDFGVNNFFAGVKAGNFTMTGSACVGVGIEALGKNTTGNGNVAIGGQALRLNTTGSNNIAVGTGSGSTLIQGSNNIYIGNGLTSDVESDTIRIGIEDSHLATFIAGIFEGTSTQLGSPVLVDSNGQLGTTVSSVRFKHNIGNMSNESERIYDLSPVYFAYNHDITETQHYGLIAEEVNKVFPELVVNDKQGKPFTVRYDVLPVLLLNEMKKLVARIEALESKISD